MNIYLAYESQKARKLAGFGAFRLQTRAYISSENCSKESKVHSRRRHHSP